MSDSDFVTLKGGIAVPLGAVLFSLDLEARGFDLVSDGDGILIGPKDRITDEDREGVRRWRHHLHYILTYCEAVQ
jgi:hypothetical protein